MVNNKRFENLWRWPTIFTGSDNNKKSNLYSILVVLLYFIFRLRKLLTANGYLFDAQFLKLTITNNNNNKIYNP